MKVESSLYPRGKYLIRCGANMKVETYQRFFSAIHGSVKIRHLTLKILCREWRRLVLFIFFLKFDFILLHNLSNLL